MFRGLRHTAWLFAILGALAALGAAAVTITSVLGRAFFTRPVQGDVEIMQFAIALAISLAIPWCQLRGANIIVDFFTQRLRQRRIQWLDSVGALLIANCPFPSTCNTICVLGIPGGAGCGVGSGS